MKFTAFILCMCCFIKISAQDPKLPGKKERKEIIQVFGEEAAIRALEFSKDCEDLQPYLKEGDAVFEVKRDEDILGYLLSTKTKGRFDFFDYSVVYSEKLTVLSMKVLVYRSEHGAGVCSKGWLKQFRGYSGGELKLGKDIDTVSGATFSASSLVKDAERCYRLMTALKNRMIN